MKRLRYNLAISLDGYIARPGGQFDWIIDDPSIDFAALTSQFDTVVMGRRTYEVMRSLGPAAVLQSVAVVVCSKTLDGHTAPGVSLLSSGVSDAIAEMKRGHGKDIWLFGGGELARTLIDADLVDTIEVSIMPVMLGEGIPMLQAGSTSPVLELTHYQTLTSGIVQLTYAVRHAAAGGTGS
ncbi:MAG TPA: dihydrofolate reductase family protein [Vicinamibacterales bacterium]|nr:dihydrofolate reductase family protein [Vicinamibacterales bacterium]